MTFNNLILTENCAAKILFNKNRAARAIRENTPKLYRIDDLLPSNALSPKTFVVWAVKTGATTYAGILIDSGIRNDDGNWVNAVRINFCDINIHAELLENDFATPYIKVVKNSQGHLGLKKILQVSEDREAALLLQKKFPDTQGKPVVMIRTQKRIGTCGKYNTFWAVWSENCYKALNPYSGNCFVFLPHEVLCVLEAGERFDGNYRLICKGNRKPRWILWRIKKEVR